MRNQGLRRILARWTVAGAVLGLAACGASRAQVPSGPQVFTPEERMTLTAAQIQAAKEALLAKHGEGQRARIERGVDQVAALWWPTDGDLTAFATAQFVADPAPRKALLERMEATLEQVEGHLLEVNRALRWPTDLDLGPLLPVDPLLAAFDPSAHLTEDLFDSKIAFTVLLNFPQTTLSERSAGGASWSREEWAGVRLAQRFARRVPGAVQQQIARAGADADLYIAEYNLWMHHVLSDGKRLFPKGMRLISHWNLRDELKADYAEPDGLAKQRLIARVMERIVTQTIPAAVIDNPRLDWDPVTNAVSASPASEVEETARPAAEPAAGREADVRYARWLAQYHAARAADPYSPVTPSLIARSFEVSREMPEERVRGLLTEVLASPQVAKVAAVIQKRLGRPLEPHDLWYNGFQPRAKFEESQLDALTRKRYPTAQAFGADIPRILQELGMTEEKARFVAARIAVDPARGAGHAMPAGRRGDQPRLRTRVGASGMDYKAYNIAVHELGHNVEQVFSLYEVDRTLLAGVPNNAFTEAIAFVFQARDLELLGLAKRDAESERMRVLNDFWATWEIAGVALVDMAAWHWMYEHPNATPGELREAVLALGKDVWNRYYAPVLGGRDSVLLGIYSHLIAYPIYLPDYPLGHLIAFQIEESLEKSPAIGPQIERMTRFGSVLPDLWMTNATGAPVSAQPLLTATEKALQGL